MTAIAGYDYLLSGESWADPGHITYSIAPDGVFWDHGTNNLNATFNAKFGTDGTWQKQIARALATWQSVANINLAPVADSPYDFNVLGSRRPIRGSETSGSGATRSPATRRPSRRPTSRLPTVRRPRATSRSTPR